jgi:hypothetical protein
MTTPVTTSTTTTKLPYIPIAKTKQLVPTRTPFRDNVMDETETEQVRRIPDTTTIQPLLLLLQQFAQQPQLAGQVK